MSFLNRHVLKPSTIDQIEAMGEAASQIADRWAGGHPKQTRRLEAEGRLILALKQQLEQESQVEEQMRQFPWVGKAECLQMLGIDPSGPPPL